MGSFEMNVLLRHSNFLNSRARRLKTSLACTREIYVMAAALKKHG